jgi:hypothetical protein
MGQQSQLPQRMVGIVVAFALAGGVPLSARGSQPARVAEDASLIRAFRLTEDHLVKLRQVSAAMARSYRPAPELPRADAAMFVVLSMSFAYNEPFRDRTVTDMVETIESGHADLATAIAMTGLTTTDYILTQVTLLLAYPLAVPERSPRPVVRASDVAAENVAFVKGRLAEIESILEELGRAARPPKPAAVDATGRILQL